ncbi:MAG: BLUF domain-containing protein [Thermoanaerobaculia bacterium]|nr:BLUF domain-containing protein [Thermoanaerobaculia bacterium]
MLIELAYCSAAKTAFTPAELTRLLRVARQNNARDGITGMLLYADGRFFHPHRERASSLAHRSRTSRSPDESVLTGG